MTSPGLGQEQSQGGAVVPANVVVVDGRYVARNGMLIPAGLGIEGPRVDEEGTDQAPVQGEVEVRTVEPAAERRDQVEPAETLRKRLAAERALVAAQREDELARRAQAVEHRLALAGVDDLESEERRSRRARAGDAKEMAGLERYYRRAARSGARARIKADINRSAEMRALRVARVRTATLAVGLPALGAFAGWSTAGVQAGVVQLIGLKDGSAGWWAAWLMEPALMAVVALIIVTRALLESSGGRTDWRSYAVEWAALGASVALNAAGGWHGTGWAVVGGLLAHSVGPLGAAGVAYLIGLLLGYVAAARPWAGAPRLVELDLAMPPAVGEISSDVRKIKAAQSEGETRKIKPASGWSEGVRAADAPRAANGSGGSERPDTEDAREGAREAWIASARAGRVMSGAELGRLYGMSERWGQAQVKEARARMAKRPATEVNYEYGLVGAR